MEGCLAKCFLDMRNGLRVLAEKSLISTNMDWGTIEMAKLLVELGRKIVREQSVDEPGKRQFLTDAVDVCEVLSDYRAVSCDFCIFIECALQLRDCLITNHLYICFIGSFYRKVAAS